jgi:hypothetical protein
VSLESCVDSSSPGSSSNISGPSARLIEPKIQRELAETVHYGLRYDFSSRCLRWSEHQRATICLTALLWRTAEFFRGWAEPVFCCGENRPASQKRRSNARKETVMIARVVK